MAYVNGTEFDVFLSYAHGNDTLRDWSLRVMAMLRESMEIMLGDREHELAVFTDEARLRGNGYVDTQLRSAVQSAGAIVIIMSGHYVKSDWCRQEGEWFGQAADPASLAERTFVVRATNVAPSEWPAFLRTDGAAGGEPILGYDFCDKGEDRLPYGLHGQQEDQLGQAVARLSQELCQMLRKRRKKAAPLAPIPVQAAAALRPRVMLGLVTEELEPEREALRARLAGSGLLDVVAPSSPEDPADVEALAQNALKTCGGLVQLCGRASGRWGRTADGFVAHQIRLFEAARHPTWLVPAAGVSLERLSVPAYAEFIAARRERLLPEPDAGTVLAALRPPAATGRVASGVVYINSRVQYEAAETLLRTRLSQLDRSRVVNARLMPVPPVFRVTDPQLLGAIMEARRRHAADIRADLLILTDRADLFNDDLFEYLRDAQGHAGPRPAAVVDASTTPGLTREDAGGYDVFRLDDPGFDGKIGAWLQASLAQDPHP